MIWSSARRPDAYGLGEPRMSTVSTRHSRPPARGDRRPAGASAVRWGREVPEAIRSLGALANADYADIVTATIDVAPDRTLDELIEATLKDVPRGLPVFVTIVQRAFLGLRLELRPSPDHLLGWKIADRGENWIRIEAASWFLTGHVVMQIDERELALASFVRYDRRLAAFVWPAISLIHRQVALTLARSAVQAL
jgi:hypothetical protein